MLRSKKYNDEYIKKLAMKAMVDEDLAVILADKGFDDENKIKTFLKPDISELTPIADIPNAQKVADTLLNRLDSGKKLLIYGDYDCDGICAISMLLLFFNKKGYDVDYHIPDRNIDGYGLSMDSAKKLVSRDIDVVLTVDCGISSAAEITYLTTNGIEVIVTDHHELPDVLPNCLICNAKAGGGGSSSDICGAGLVLRIIEAMASKVEMAEYLDIAAIATIADVVPLTGDNRIIAKLGQNRLNFLRRPGIRILAEKSGRKGELTASDIGFCIAPRINAAGRMASALDVPRLFTEKDGFLLETLADKLIVYNKERQLLCEQVYLECIEYLKSQKIEKTRCIVHFSENWEVGILGIACARLASEFNVPVILFSAKGDKMKGSARSIDGVNLHAEMKKAEKLCLSFGGHSGACGVSVLKEKYAEYKSEIEWIFSLVGAEYFRPVKSYEYDIVNGDINLALCFAIKELEPTGEANKKPIIRYNGNLDFKRINLSEHLKARAESAEVLAFFGYKNLSAFSSGADISYYLDLGVNEYKNKFSAQALVRTFEVCDIENAIGSEYDIAYYKSMLTKTKSFETAEIAPSADIISNFINKTKENVFFGSAFIARRLATAKNFLRQLKQANVRENLINIFFSDAQTDAPFNSLILYDGESVDLSAFGEVFFLDPSPYGISKILFAENTPPTKVVFSDFGVSPSITEDDILEAMNKIEEALPFINNKGYGINSVNSLYSLLQKGLKYDIIKFNIIFNILYARKMLEVSNKAEKTFFLKTFRASDAIATSYDGLIVK